VRDLEAVKGVGPGAAKKLKDAFITSAELLAVQNPIELRANTGLGEGTCETIVENARELCGIGAFQSGLEFEQELASKPRLRTGIEKIDANLLGGIEVGSLVEFYGPARGVKTQWVSQLAVRVQLPLEEGGLEGRVLWLDSESSLRPWIIRANALRYGLDPDVALGNINRAEILVSGQIHTLFRKIPRMCAEEGFKLVVVDSFTGLFRAEFATLDTLRPRQAEINNILNQMRRFGRATDAIYVFTNQSTSKIPQGYGKASPNAPVGGHIVAHASDYRFYTRRVSVDQRKLSLQDNAGVPEFDADLRIGWGGFYSDLKSKNAKEPDIVEYFEKKGWSTDYEKLEEELEEAEAAA
jgi:DNA repair protein RadA